MQKKIMHVVLGAVLACGSASVKAMDAETQINALNGRVKALEAASDQKLARSGRHAILKHAGSAGKIAVVGAVADLVAKDQGLMGKKRGLAVFGAAFVTGLYEYYNCSRSK